MPLALSIFRSCCAVLPQRLLSSSPYCLRVYLRSCSCRSDPIHRLRGPLIPPLSPRPRPRFLWPGFIISRAAPTFYAAPSIFFLFRTLCSCQPFLPGPPLGCVVAFLPPLRRPGFASALAAPPFVRGQMNAPEEMMPAPPASPILPIPSPFASPDMDVPFTACARTCYASPPLLRTYTLHKFTFYKQL